MLLLKKWQWYFTPTLLKVSFDQLCQKIFKLITLFMIIFFCSPLFLYQQTCSLSLRASEGMQSTIRNSNSKIDPSIVDKYCWFDAFQIRLNKYFRLWLEQNWLIVLRLLFFQILEKDCFFVLKSRLLSFRIGWVVSFSSIIKLKFQSFECHSFVYSEKNSFEKIFSNMKFMN